MTGYKLKKKNQTLTIMPFSDIHYGSPQCDTDFFEFQLNKFDKITGAKIIYLLGDECDVGVKRQGNSAYEQEIDVNEQLDYIIQSFKPYKKYIRGIVQSNHMARTKKEFDLDISQVIASALDIPYKNNIYETLSINDKPYTVYATHGTKTSSQLHLMQGALQRMTDHIDGNLFLAGHCHLTSCWSQPRISHKEYTRRYYGLCGHMLSYFGGYAEIMGLKPNPPSFVKFNIDSNLRTTFSIYNKDECKEMF